jgi:hypothetical protein
MQHERRAAHWRVGAGAVYAGGVELAARLPVRPLKCCWVSPRSLCLIVAMCCSCQVARGLGLDPGAAPKPKATRRQPLDPDRPRPPKPPKPEKSAAGEKGALRRMYLCYLCRTLLVDINLGRAEQSRAAAVRGHW